jgi:hypothetical protein
LIAGLKYLNLNFCSFNLRDVTKPEDMELFENYLIGSQTPFNTLEIDSMEQVDAILKVLKEHIPTCLTKLKTVYFEILLQTKEEDARTVQVIIKFYFYNLCELSV